MQQVITQKQVKQITGGRTPLVPVEYEQAIKALTACRTFDEAKYWDNKADALAAWAKIYRDGKAAHEAGALKLWAYRRMGQLAAELRPGGNGGKSGAAPGPISLLREQGLGPNEARASRTLARAEQIEVKRLMALPKPPAPCSIFGRRLEDRIRTAPRPGSTGPKKFSTHENWPETSAALSEAERILKRSDPVLIGRSVTTEAADKVRLRVIFLIEWLDAFDQALPNGKT